MGVALGMPKLPAKLRPHVQDLPDWAAQFVAAALVYAYESGIEVNLELLAVGLSLASAGRMGWRKFKVWQGARKARKLLAVAAARQGELNHARNMRRVRHGMEPDRPLIARELLDPDDDDLDHPRGRLPPFSGTVERIADPDELTPAEGVPFDDDEV